MDTGTGSESRSLATANASRIDGTANWQICCLHERSVSEPVQVPKLKEEEWPNAGPSPSAYLASAPGIGSFSCFLCFFFGTRDKDQCQDTQLVGGALHTIAEVLGAESECSSKAALRAASTRRTFNFASQCFLVRGLKFLQIWQQSFLSDSPKHLRKLECGSLNGLDFAAGSAGLEARQPRHAPALGK